MPKTAHRSPHTLSQNRIRKGLRAVTGSLPVRMALTPPVHVSRGSSGHLQHGPPRAESEGGPDGP